MTDQALAGSYDYRLVILSVLIAFLASYTSFDLAGRVTASRGRARFVWLTAGAGALGIGIWSMHYIGMLAFSLPVPIQYHWPTILLSLAAAVFASLVALFVVSRRKMGPLRALAGAICMGGATVALPYIAMAAMRLAAQHHYARRPIALSALLAVAVSWAALWLAFSFRDETPGRRKRKMAGATLMGIGIVSVPYTALTAVTFTPSATPPDLFRAVSVSSLWIAGIGSVCALVLVITLLTSMAHRLAEQKTLLDELFAQAPNAVALVDSRDRVVRINREFTRIFGCAPMEIIGRPLTQLIACQQSRDQAYWGLVKRGQRLEVEDVCRRKDGSCFDVAVILAPFSLPSGEAAVYAIYRDITERKRADDALRELSGQLLRTQDEERRRLARELHDSTGQKLAALALNLSVVQQSSVLHQSSVVHQSQATADLRARRALDESLALTGECLREIRTLAYLLHPPELEELGLADAARNYVNGFAQRSGIPIDLELSPDLSRLPGEAETALFRILQESLNNVRRHSGSPGASVHIYRSPASITLEVQDAGQGLPPGDGEQHSQPAVTTGVGVAGMRERVRQLGGQFEIRSTESGTTLKVVLPLN
jgi:PAS domain S-box-containing protein